MILPVIEIFKEVGARLSDSIKFVIIAINHFLPECNINIIPLTYRSTNQLWLVNEKNVYSHALIVRSGEHIEKFGGGAGCRKTKTLI